MVAIIGILTLSACGVTVATVTAPGKSYATLRSDSQFCYNYASHWEDFDTAYARCLNDTFGDTVEFDGKIYRPSPPIQYTPPPIQAQQNAPPPAPTYESNRKSESSVSRSQQTNEGSLTPEQKQELVDAGVAAAKNAVAACAVKKLLLKTPFLRCFAITWVEEMTLGMGREVIIPEICKNPDILKNISSDMTPDVENNIVDYMGCIKNN